MKHKLDCRIVRDLFPLYVEGLTSEYTNQAVEEHLIECAECSKILEYMNEEEQKAPVPEKEIDCMKKVNSKMKGLLTVSIITSLIVVLCILAGWLILDRMVPKKYVDIFSKHTPAYYSISYPVTDSEMELEGFDCKDFTDLLQNAYYYYDGTYGNEMKGNAFHISVLDESGEYLNYIITDENMLYYNDKSYDIDNNSEIVNYLQDRMLE